MGASTRNMHNNLKQRSATKVSTTKEDNDVNLVPNCCINVTHHIKTGQLSVECISRYYSICMEKKQRK